MRRIALLFLSVLFIASAAYLAQEDTPWSAPETEKQKKNPAKNDAASSERGRELYNKQCLSCHGEKGTGDGPIARRLGFSPGDLSNSKAMNAQSDGEIFWKITNGRDAMPGFKADMGLTDEQIWDLVTYTRTLSSPSGEKSVEKKDPSESK